MRKTPTVEAEVVNRPRSRVLEHELLRVFVCVVDCGGYTAAAQALHRTQAAISQQIKRLEESAQTALFQHPRRAVELTDDGRTLLEYARRLIALNDEALSSLKSDGVRGKVRIGANNYYATAVLPQMLARFCAANPGVQIEMHTGSAHDMDRRLGLAYDLLINIYPVGSGSGVVLRREQLHWVGAKVASPHLRTPLPLALMPKGSLLRDIAIATLGASRRDWHLAQESSNIMALEASTAAGLAVSIFQKASVVSPHLRILDEHDGMPALPQIEICMVPAERYLPRAAVKLHEFLLGKLLPAAA